MKSIFRIQTSISNQDFYVVTEKLEDGILAVKDYLKSQKYQFPSEDIILTTQRISDGESVFVI